MFLSILSNTLVRNKKLTAKAVRMCSTSMSKFETLAVTVPKPFVYHVELNRPDKANAMNDIMWVEISKCFDELSVNSECRAVVISGAGKLFSAGIDFGSLMAVAPELAEAEDVARKAKIFTRMLKRYQNSFTAIDVCNKPVIAAVHSACIGAGVDLVTATDIRYCTKDAYFQVKEVDLGMAADVGTLQRLPKVIGSQSLVRDLCYTGRKMKADEALSSGLVSRVFGDKDSMIAGAVEMAAEISSKSPVAVQTTKQALNYARDHSVQESLNQIALLNQCMLQSEDFTNAVIGQASKQTDIQFSKL